MVVAVIMVGVMAGVGALIWAANNLGRGGPPRGDGGGAVFFPDSSDASHTDHHHGPGCGHGDHGGGDHGGDAGGSDGGGGGD